MIRALLVAITFLSVSAAAQTGPCSAGIQDPPIFSVVPGSPVRLSFNSTTQAMLAMPEVTMAGNAITVVQLASGANQFHSPDCNRQSVSLGDLPPGSYSVTWNYQAGQSPGPPAIYFATFSFAFTVPEAAPCVLGMNVQPQSPAAGQPVSIVYAIPFRAFLQSPSVAMDGNQITIDQSAFIADPAFPGHIPCARGAVQVGSLQPGYYMVTVRTNSGAPLSGSFVVQPLMRGRAVRGH
jgi:hypothetical protein